MSVIYTIPVCNKYWAPLDEGLILVASQRLLAGEIPYKDFFIVMYPPGQIYILAALLKIFSNSLLAGRIYTVFISVGISLLVYSLTYRLTQNKTFSFVSWFVALVSLAPRLGAIPAPIWPGVFLALCALYFSVRYLENLEHLYLIVAGIFTGLSILFRHDIGIFAFVSIFITFFIKALYNKNQFRAICLFTIYPLIVIAPPAAYLAIKSATNDIVKSLFLFPFIHQRTAGLAFPKPCFNLNMIFHGSLQFIKINQYYIPILVYAFILIYLLSQILKKRLNENRNFAMIPILLFGVFTFNQVMIRTDPAHLLTVIAPAVILFGFILNKTFSYEFSIKKIQVLLTYITCFVIMFLFMLLSIKNIDKYIKNTYRKPYKRKIVKATFDSGTIYIPKRERDEVVNTVDFIKKNTLSDERIYVGNIAHWKDDFGGSTILYFLANRLPSTKYYELLPGLVTDPEVQREIKESLERYKVNLLVLQDIDLGKTKKPSVSRDKFLLDDFIGRNFKRVKKFGKYNIYMRESS